jgi:hypothetical protein
MMKRKMRNREYQSEKPFLIQKLPEFRLRERKREKDEDVNMYNEIPS